METYEEYFIGSIKVIKNVSPLRILNTSRQEYLLVITRNNVPRVHIDSENMLLSVTDDKKKKYKSHIFPTLKRSP